MWFISFLFTFNYLRCNYLIWNHEDTYLHGDTYPHAQTLFDFNVVFWLWVGFHNIIFTIANLKYHFSNIIFKTNELDLLWVLNFIALGIYFIFGTKFFWNAGIDTCFNVEYVLLGRNFDYFGGYLVVTARYLVVTGAYCLLLVVTARYQSLLLVPTFSMNNFNNRNFSCTVLSWFESCVIVFSVFEETMVVIYTINMILSYLYHFANLKQELFRYC